MTDNMSADFFLTNTRIDIVAKFLYAKYRENGYNTNFALDLYERHLRVWNGFNEIDNESKNSFEDFLVTFHQILDSIKSIGYDDTLDTVPVTDDGFLLNGSHRVASCLLYDKPVSYHTTNDMSEGEYDCSSFYFRRLGLDEKYLDAMAVEYAKLKKNTYVVSLFPSATSMNLLDRAEEILTSESDLVYVKDIVCTNGALNIVRQLYLGEEWGGTWNNNFSGFLDKARLCFTSNYPMRVYLVELDDVEQAKTLKNKIRNIYGLGNHSCHINDTHAETLRLSRVFFNENSMHYINNSNMVYYPNFYSMLDYYSRYIKDNELDGEDYCVTASSILSLYGLREGNDLDYLTSGNAILGHSDIHSHNDEIQNYTVAIDDVLYNPTNHFYFDGIKFAGLNVIRELKNKRKEPKDFVDLELMETLM